MELKTIVYRGGVVTFRVPMDWIEEYGERGGGTFYRDTPQAGILRLYVTTMSNEKVVSPELIYNEAIVDYRGIKQSFLPDLQLLPNGNSILRHRRTSWSWFRRIVLHFWQVYNPVPPHHMRLALFSYTILKTLDTNPETLQDIDLLDREIRDARFYSELGY